MDFNGVYILVLTIFLFLMGFNMIRNIYKYNKKNKNIKKYNDFINKYKHKKNYLIEEFLNEYEKVTIINRKYDNHEIFHISEKNGIKLCRLIINNYDCKTSILFNNYHFEVKIQ